MKNRTKAALAWMLCIAILVPSVFTAPVFGASSSASVLIPCASDLYDDDMILLYSDGADLYVTADQAAQLSGYAPVTEPSAQEITFACTYRTWADPVTVSYDLTANGQKYFRLDHIMTELRTSVFEEAGKVVFLSRRASVEDLKKLCYEVFFGLYKDVLYVQDDLGSSGTKAKRAAAIYNIISSYGFTELLSYDNGLHTADQYQDLLTGLIEHTSLEWESLTKELDETLGLVSKLAKENLESEYDEDFATLMSHVQKWGGASNGDAAQIGVVNLGKAVSLLTNPAGEFIKWILKDDGAVIKEATGEGFTLSGLDFFTWLEITDYINAIAVCTSTDFKMFERSFFENGVLNRYFAPPEAQDTLQDIHDMYLSEDFSKGQEVMFRDMMVSVAHKTGKKIIGGTVLTTVMGMSNPYAALVSLTQSAMKAGLDWAFNASDRMDYAEQAKLIRELQELLRSKLVNLTATIATNQMDPLDFKYVTMLYLRLAKQNQENLIKAMGTEKTKDYQALHKLINNDLQELYRMSDSDLENGFTVERITMQSLGAAETGSMPSSGAALIDLIGQPFTKVEEIFGETEWVDNEAGICLDYELENDIVYCICDWDYSEWGSDWSNQKDKARVDELDWSTYVGMKPEERVILGNLTTYMGEPQIREYLQGYTFEKWTEQGSSWDGSYHDDTYLSAQSDQYYILFHWNSRGYTGVNDPTGMPIAVTITSMEARKRWGFLVDEEE